MKTLALLLLTLAASTAETERFYLSDGRELIGEYDEDSGYLDTTVNGQSKSILVRPGEIVERAPYVEEAPAADDAPVAMPEIEKTPSALSPEESAAAKRELAYQMKVKEAEDMESQANKAERDADRARKEARKKREEALRHLRQFRERALLEGVTVSEPDDCKRLIILPKTAGNNRSAVDAWTLAGKKEEKAAELDETAKRKHQEAERLRSQAEKMPRGDQ